MHINERRLLKLGWTQEEISKTRVILKNKKTSRLGKTVDNLTTFTIIVLAALGNATVAIALSPLLIMNNTFFFLALIGIAFGFAFGLIMVHTRWHAIVLIAILTLILVSLVMRSAIMLENTLVPISQNPYALAIIYTASFIIPIIILRKTINGSYHLAH